MLLAIFFGAALGNVVRGVPLNQAGDFFLPLWTDFTAGPDAGILDWYTISIAVAAFLTLAVHGAHWLALKTEGAVEERARAVARRLWLPLLVVIVAITLASFRVQPHLSQSFRERPWGYVFPAVALAGLIAMRLTRDRNAFLSSAAFIIGMLTSVAFGVYPYVLPASSGEALSLTIHNAAAGRYGLRVGLIWFFPGMALAAGYFVYTYRSFAGKVRLDGEGY
jgi:cytochrome d ubiquinol oxidase subunit II